MQSAATISMAEIDTEKFDGNRDSKKLESTSIEKSLSGNEPSGAISAEDLKKAKWAWFKCDINIVGWAWVLYLVSVIDRYFDQRVWRRAVANAVLQNQCWECKGYGDAEGLASE